MKLRYLKLPQQSQAVVKSLKTLTCAISRQHLGRLAGSAFFIFTTVSSQGLLLLLTPNSSKVAAAPALCANPGRDGSVTPTGVVNTYYPGTASANAGATSISIGSINTAGATTPIAAGDLLLVIQMQDAAINSNNTSAYGANNASGSGSTNLNNSGLYEYVVATGAVTGGSVPIKGAGTSGGLLNTYTNADATSTQGQRRFQVVRVPQYSSVTTLSGVTAAAWNGATGGIVAVDVAGSVGGGSINVSGQGFRGGGGRGLSGGTGGTGADFLNLATNNFHGAKGEGIAGTPRYVLNASSLLDTTVEGYPNGSTGQGAPGNAGGGGTDANPSANDQNSGGGGGSNAGAGGKGGNAWSSGATVGGIGGAAFSGANRLVLGGGGGAGSTNNATGTPGSGLASSGAAGGGIVMLRTGTLSGVTITADGTSANNTVANDGSGGGGAGGSVLVSATSASSVTVSAKGGTGGTNTGGGAAHGPGGGGGGGFVVSSTTVTATATVTGGANGTTAGTPSNFGASAGATGQSTTISTTIPGAGSGAECLPTVAGYKSVKLTTDADANNAPTPGDTLTWTFSYANTGPSDVSNFQITDSLPTGVTSTGTPTISTNTTQGTAPAVNTSYNGSSNTNLLSSTTTLKVGGAITVNLPVRINSGVTGTLSNQASATGTLVTAVKTDNVDSNTTNLPTGVSVPTGSIAQTQTASIDPTTVTVGSVFNVSGTLYKDNNSNSTFDSGTDSTLPANITVTLYNDANNNNLIDTGEQVGSPVTTNASGNYTFTNIPNGTYKIEVDTADTDIPSGFAIQTSNDLTVTVNGANVSGQNFGFIALPSSFGSCSTNSYISYNNPNTLGALNTNTLTLDTVGTSTVPYNAIGYNIANNLIYGIRRTTATAAPYNNSNELMVIGSNGVPVNLGAVNGLPLTSLYNSGDVAANNIYYVVNGLVATKTFYKIDVNPASSTYKQIVGSFSLPAPYNTTAYSFGDIAFNPVDGQNYAVLNTVNTSNVITAQQLAKIDSSSGNVTLLGTPTLIDIDSFIGLFVDNTGYIYGYQGTAGKLWRYDRITGARVLIKDSLPTASNNADGARCYNAPPISTTPKLLLVKRITAVDSTTYTTVKDDPNDQNDNNANWPSSFLQGEYIAPDKAKPGSTVEYTIYFLSAGINNAQNASICDLIPADTTFSLDAFGSGKGIQQLSGTSTATNLTNTADTDAGQFYSTTETPPASCRIGQTITNGNGTFTPTNVGGAVVVNLGTVPTKTNDATKYYGYVRFKVTVK